MTWRLLLMLTGIARLTSAATSDQLTQLSSTLTLNDPTNEHMDGYSGHLQPVTAYLLDLDGETQTSRDSRQWCNVVRL